jgi:hypothetical protein
MHFQLMMPFIIKESVILTSHLVEKVLSSHLIEKKLNTSIVFHEIHKDLFLKFI